MLRRELYVGRMVWNRSHFVKVPGTNKRVARPRPRSEWRLVEQPELRIVSEELWQAVQARQSTLAKLYGGNHRGLLNRSASSGNLLTRFLKCGLCGANLVIVTGRRRRHAMYGCPTHWYRGACANKLRIRQSQIERELLSGLQEALLHPDATDYVLQEFQRQLGAAQADTSVRQERSRERKRELQQQLDRLTAAVAEGGHSSFLLDAISERERELAELEASATATEGRLATDPEKLRQFTLERLSRLPELLSLDVPRARAELAKHVGQITLAPAELDGRPNYICQGDWNLLGTLEGRGDVRMVAGACNHPNVPSIHFRFTIQPNHIRPHKMGPNRSKR